MFEIRKRIGLVAGSALAAASLLASRLAAASDDSLPTAAAVRADGPIVVDGDLSEPAWEKAPPIGDLFQTDPHPGEPVSERTEVRVLYDDKAIYFGFRCFDSEPDRVIATQMARNGSTFLDDRVSVIIDTFRDRRNAFLFRISAGGAREDALVADNGSRVDEDWDGIWSGRTLLTEDGWTAEMRIPFRTISFRPESTVWGLNVERLVRRKVEFARWASPVRDFDFDQVAQAGTLEGLEGLTEADRGIGLDVRPYGLARWTHVESRDDTDDDGRFEAGGDAFWRITPALTASLTVNTDFAETEVDDRQVNLTRFPLFFPEKRDFFLEDASLFEFGSRSQDLIPFFSRRIGLAGDGRVVPILVGGKLAGRSGPFNVGLLDVQTARSGGIEGQNLAAARVSANVLDQSTVGAILTRGDPTGETENVLAGLDANYRITDLFGDKNLVVRAFGLATHSTGDAGDDAAFGGSVSYPNDFFDAGLSAQAIGKDFEPALGFVPRRGIREYEGEFRLSPRPGGFIRSLRHSVDARLVTDTGNEIETSEVEVQPVSFIFDSGDEIELGATYTHETLDEDFDIQDDVVIPEGQYDFAGGVIEIEGGSKRPVVPTVAFAAGEFFDGTRQDYFLGAEVKAWRHLFVSSEYERSDISLPGGDFTVHVARLRATVNFTPDVSWTQFVQYDSESENLGLNSRFRYIIEDGRELFVVLNAAFDEGSKLDLAEGELTVKFEYTFRF